LSRKFCGLLCKILSVTKIFINIFKPDKNSQFSLCKIVHRIVMKNSQQNCHEKFVDYCARLCQWQWFFLGGNFVPFKIFWGNSPRDIIIFWVVISSLSKFSNKEYNFSATSDEKIVRNFLENFSKKISEFFIIFLFIFIF
jgi:hypothetical protein